MKPVILIPARMASTRLPGKPLATIDGIPMIVHVLRQAERADCGDVFVACCEDEVKTIVESYGGTAIMTDPCHPSGTDRIWDALGQIDQDCQYDVIINLQGDLPTIDPSIIQEAVALLQEKNADIATLACPIAHKDELHNPNVVKVAMNADQRALYFSRAPIPHGEGPYYHHIGLYVYKRNALEQFVALPPTPLEKQERLEQLRALEHHMHISVGLVNTVPNGIDTKEDLEEAIKYLESVS